MKQIAQHVPTQRVEKCPQVAPNGDISATKARKNVSQDSSKNLHKNTLQQKEHPYEMCIIGGVFFECVSV